MQLLSPVHTSNNVDSTLNFVKRRTIFYDKLVQHCCLFGQKSQCCLLRQSRTLRSHCCRCPQSGRGFDVCCNVFKPLFVHVLAYYFN